MDFKWQVLDSGMDRPLQLGPTIPWKPRPLAEFRLQLDFDAVGPGKTKLDGKELMDRWPGPYMERNPGPRVFKIRLERLYCTPNHASCGFLPVNYEMRLVFEPSPYGTKEDWDGVDPFTTAATGGYWDDQEFVRRKCPAPPARVLPYIQDNCVVS